MKHSFLFASIAIACLSENEANESVNIKDFNIKLFGNEYEQPALDRLIIGGEETVLGRYPYQAGLLYSNKFLSNVFYCGGTLISPEWVLSAAHCFESDLEYVDIGRHNRYDASEFYEKKKIDFVVVHPGWNLFTAEHDVLLIKLATPSNFTPITLDPDFFDPDLNATVIGWGVPTNETTLANHILFEVETESISNEECQERRESSNSTLVINDDVVCTLRKGRGACFGDSGGPLFIKGENASLDKQVGIVSYLISNCNHNYPTVYARISEEFDFINSTMFCTVPEGIDLRQCCDVKCKNGVFFCAREGAFVLDECDVSDRCKIGDGVCNRAFYNLPECNYDGGDCCEDTCEGIYCGLFKPEGCASGYQCKDPGSKNTMFTPLLSLFLFLWDIRRYVNIFLDQFFKILLIKNFSE